MKYEIYTHDKIQRSKQNGITLRWKKNCYSRLINLLRLNCTVILKRTFSHFLFTHSFLFSTQSGFLAMAYTYSRSRLIDEGWKICMHPHLGTHKSTFFIQSSGFFFRFTFKMKTKTNEKEKCKKKLRWRKKFEEIFHEMKLTE